MKRRSITFAATLALVVTGVINCNTTTDKGTAVKKVTSEERVPVYHFEVVNAFPHDANAFTQGLVFRQGKLFESTGQEGRSSLREVELETGQVLRKVDVPPPYFAEGLTLLNNKLYQLTWQHQLGFVYDVQTFQQINEFAYSGEGWGLTDDGESLILSDGTNRIRFLDPTSFSVIRTISVYNMRQPVTEINELEYIHGEIYANIWHENRIARINPQDGRVTGWIDLTGLRSQVEVHDDEAVLNGIAYDSEKDRLFVTGKLWPKLFEIRLKP
ncbi:MAG TPA: glutaminyl-peptide cyclotransferase [Pyrinomonadaceae bacterium]|nr:glutaminyl-peptide cyclotransferase [Pyrinomonadaceae bacterium]